MNTLEQLNNYSTTSISFTDNRPAGVVLSYPNARDIEVTLTGLSHVVQRRIDILEVVGGATADVTYEIDLDTVAGTVTWSTIPAGCTVIQTGNKFKITGITSKTIWDTVRAPTITLPSDFAGSFAYDATIRYYSGLDLAYKTQSWEVGIFRPDALISSTATLSCTANRTRSTPVSLDSVFAMELFFVKVMGVESTLACTPVKTADFGSATYASTTTLSAKPKTFLYADQTITIDAPYPENGGNFGGFAQNGDLEIVRSQYLVSSYDDDNNFLASVFSIGNGTKQFDFATRGGGTSPEASIRASDDFAIVTEVDTGYAKFQLYKFNDTGTMYTHVEDIDIPTQGSFNGILRGMTDTHAIASDPTGDGEVYVYSIDDTDGFTLDATHTAPLGSYDRRLGEACAINDTYYVAVENIQSGGANRRNIRVYDVATNTLQRTINNDLQIKEMTWDGNNIIAIGDANNGYISSWDVTDGSQNYSFTRSTGSFLGDKIRKVNNTYLAYKVTVGTSDQEAIEFVNTVNQDWDHRVTTTGQTITNFEIIGEDKLVLGFAGHDDDETNQGKIEIRIET